jgi:hypothetical protein
MAIMARNPEPLPRHLDRYAREVDEWHRDAMRARATRRPPQRAKRGTT